MRSFTVSSTVLSCIEALFFTHTHTEGTSSLSSLGSFSRRDPSPCLCASVCLSRQLLHSSNLSSSNGSTEDLFRDSIDSCDIDINEKVRMCYWVYFEQPTNAYRNDL